MSDTRYWLLVLLIPLLGLPLSGVFVIGPVELALWLVLLVVWSVAFVKHDRLDPRVPIVALGAVLVVGLGIAGFNYLTVEGSHPTTETDSVAD